MKQENHTRSDSILVSFYWKMIFYLFLANSYESNDVCVLLLVKFLFQILLFVSLLDEFVDVVSFLYCLPATDIVVGYLDADCLTFCDRLSAYSTSYFIHTIRLYVCECNVSTHM